MRRCFGKCRGMQNMNRRGSRLTARVVSSSMNIVMTKLNEPGYMAIPETAKAGWLFCASSISDVWF